MKIASYFSKLLPSSKSRRWALVGLVLADGLVFCAASPRTAPSWLLIIGFLLLVATFYMLMLAVLRLLSWYGGFGHDRSQRYSKRLARIITGVVAGLVALQSIGELSSRDIVVLLPLMVLTYLYISYGSATPKQAVRSSA